MLLRPLLCLLAMLTLSACMTREARRELPWDHGGYADPEGAAFMGYHGAPNRRTDEPGS
ncbi:MULTISPECIES: hypothetical protein [Ramlibacter]|jgi:hypothetical protein|uniref:Lipoprotein n=1 Tax=Ramlibacter pinisoli TaxID=2682844 RepID=A0A6N8IQ73_9BURK|nr:MULTISPECIES: hypothetical protein [Ramlibacter]MBA2964065.1 hypothetical protein [Ramlibacter sp. CGMCC 1.13660]MVQ29031.1 hypothetical protein [Ramlibacter pinisoli]